MISFALPPRVLVSVVRLGNGLLTFRMGRDWGRYGTISKRVIFIGIIYVGAPDHPIVRAEIEKRPRLANPDATFLVRGQRLSKSS